ncbi:MAG: beta-hexosaminidase, partial [Lachnospiraceae bacterium]|nr:beta-hexosaminidase [Lachnospiraceae bacterium]
ASETDSTEESFDEFYAQYDPNNKYIMSKDVEKKIEEIIDGMTLEEKVGQVFFIKNDGRFDGGILDKYPVGGVILFKGDFSGKTEEDVKANIADLQDNSKVPLLVGIDEEGGTVVRISEYSHLVPEKYKSPMDLYYEGGFDVIRQDTINKSELLLSYGINVNFAPVCDIPDDTGDFIFNRSMGGDLNLTVNYVGLSVETMSSVGMGSVLKHFPGYGNNGDTHSGIVKDSRPIEEFEATDFIPFKAGIEAGAWCVLVSHLVVESMDPAYPASLSPEVHRMLREDMGYEGVIITDDLMMKGVSEVFSEGDAAVQALLAGNDMVLSTDYQVQYAAVLRAVKSGEISEEQLENSIRRILRWKYTLGLLDI